MSTAAHAVVVLAAGSSGRLGELCDQPAIDAAHLRRLVQVWRADPGRAVASSYSGAVGVPAVLPRSWFASLSELKGDRGARHLLRARSAEVGVVPAAALARDVDVPADLDAIHATRARERRR